MTYRINVLVDWGKAFVDEDGSFYCGTTDEHKLKAAAIIDTNPDLILSYSDTHSLTAPEFAKNGGLFPVHNLVKSQWEEASKLPELKGKTVSPELTDILQEKVKDRNAGIIAPRHVFFQDYNGEDVAKPAYVIEDVIETYGVPLLNPTDFLEGNIDYIIQTKNMFDGTDSLPTQWMPNYEGVPDDEVTACSLLSQKYGLGKELQFDVTGVVTGICVSQTAQGIRRKFPLAEINVISDACTHLEVPELGITSTKHGDAVMGAIFKQTGINYITTSEYLGKQS